MPNIVRMPDFPPRWADEITDPYEAVREAYPLIYAIRHKTKVGGSRDSSIVRLPRRPYWDDAGEWLRRVSMDILREVEVVELGVDPLVSAAACDLRDVADLVCQQASPVLSERALVVERRLIELLAERIERFRYVTKSRHPTGQSPGL